MHQEKIFKYTGYVSNQESFLNMEMTQQQKSLNKIVNIFGLFLLLIMTCVVLFNLLL